MKLIFISKEDRAEDWREHLLTQIPEMEFLIWPDDLKHCNLTEIDYAIAWKPPEGVLKKLTGLKFIQSLGAGVDGLLQDSEIPHHVPISRMVDRSLIQGMTEYLLYNVLHYHRKMGEYAAQQVLGSWKALQQIDPRKRRVGIMGLGELGRDIANKLLSLEFNVAAWSRSFKNVAGVTCFHGEAELDEFLGRTEILICLLPLTPITQGIINADNLTKLPKGAVIINCARGGHVIDSDLLMALDTGHIGGACLDVFNEEPLSTEHPYWTHPLVRITPHTASLTAPHSAAQYVAQNIRRVEQGKPPLNIVDMEAGY